MISSTLLVKETNYGLDFAPLKLNTVYNFINEMKKIKFGYLLKNIPTTNERNYKLQLIKKIELFIKKL